MNGIRSKQVNNNVTLDSEFQRSLVCAFEYACEDIYREEELVGRDLP